MLAWCGGAVVLSVLSYPLLQFARTNRWCKFVGSSPHEFKAQLRGQLTSARTSYNSLASLGSAEEAWAEERASRPEHLQRHVSDQAEFLGEDISSPKRPENGTSEDHVDIEKQPLKSQEEV